jgi:hypothetical protein
VYSFAGGVHELGEPISPEDLGFEIQIEGEESRLDGSAAAAPEDAGEEGFVDRYGERINLCFGFGL